MAYSFWLALKVLRPIIQFTASQGHRPIPLPPHVYFAFSQNAVFAKHAKVVAADAYRDVPSLWMLYFLVSYMPAPNPRRILFCG